MNKKGVIAIIVIIVLAVAGYMIWGKGTNTTVTNEQGNSAPAAVPEGVTKDTYAPVTKDNVDTSLLGRLKSASVSASESGNRVALVNGTAKFSEDGVKGTITLGDVAIAKKSSGVDYVLAPLSVDSGTNVQYVVLFEDKSGTLSDKSYAVIGNGVKVTGIRADEVSDASGKTQLVVSVTYTQSGASRTKILVVENGAFNPAKEINL